MSKPTFTIRAEKETADFARFVIEPLETGYGVTVGNSLRRVLLADIAGAAVTMVKIRGVRHRFFTLKGLSEDVIEFLLNVKKIRLSYTGDKPEKMVLEKNGAGEIMAGEIEMPPTVEIMNPDLVLGNLSGKDTKFKVEFVVESGVGYLPTEGRKGEKLGEIPVDAIFTPVTNVNYKVEKTRVGVRTDLDRLILEITTDKTVAPGEAMKQAANILISYFRQVVDPVAPPKKETMEKMPVLTGVMSLTVEELDLPTRIANALRRGGYKTVADLTEASISDLEKVKNLGEKSIKVVQAALVQKDSALRETK